MAFLRCQRLFLPLVRVGNAGGCSQLMRRRRKCSSASSILIRFLRCCFWWRVALGMTGKLSLRDCKAFPAQLEEGGPAQMVLVTASTPVRSTSSFWSISLSSDTVSSVSEGPIWNRNRNTLVNCWLKQAFKRDAHHCSTCPRNYLCFDLGSDGRCRCSECAPIVNLHEGLRAAD